MARPHCLDCVRQAAWRAFSRAWAKTGNRIAARMAMVAITTSNSISVNAVRCKRVIPVIPGSHPPAWVDPVAVVEHVFLAIARLGRRAADDIIGGLFRPRPAGVAIKEDIVAAHVMAPVPVLLQ